MIPLRVVKLENAQYSVYQTECTVVIKDISIKRVPNIEIRRFYTNCGSKVMVFTTSSCDVLNNLVIPYLFTRLD